MMFNRRSIFSFVAIAGWTAAAAFAQPTTTSTLTRQFSFPPIGLAPTETAQITVINMASNPTNGNAASCTGAMTFMSVPTNGSAGSVIGSATNFTVTAGANASAKLSGGGLFAARQEIRGTVTLTLSAATAAPCSLSIVLETYDTGTGATHAWLNGGTLAGLSPGPGR